MATTIHLRLRGEAEKLVKELGRKYSLSETEIIEKALGLLKLAEETERVAVLKPQYAQFGQTTVDDVVESLLTIADTPQTTKKP